MKSLESLEAGAGLVRAIRATPGILEPDATELLETATLAAQEARGASGFSADQAVLNAVDIQRNGARAILLNAVLEVKKVLSKGKVATTLILEGAAKQIGAEMVKQMPIAAFVAGARDIFISLWQGTAGSETVHQLVLNIREFISHLRG